MSDVKKQGFHGRDIPDERITDQCVRCGMCLPHCPTYLETLHETSSPRGRIHLIEAVQRGQLSLTDPGFVHQMYQCLDCRACEAVCPSGVQYGKLVESARTQIEKTRSISPGMRLVRWFIFRKLFSDLRVFRFFSRLLYLYQKLGLQWLARHLGILRLFHLAEMESLLPRLPAVFFIAANQRYEARVGIAEEGGVPPQVALFAGCIMSTVFAETERATLRVLGAHGCSVSVPAGQGCCGALTIHAGAMDIAREMARRNIEAFERSNVDLIINNAAGCGAALKEYAHILRDDPVYAGRAIRFSQRVRDISEFLAVQPVKPVIGTVKLHATYQEPCHLVHAQRISEDPRLLLKRIPGLELVEMTEARLCCGSAGIYNITQPAMSKRLRTRKIEHVKATEAEVVITANPGCFLQLHSGLSQSHTEIRVMHIVDVLDQAYRQND